MKTQESFKGEQAFAISQSRSILQNAMDSNGIQTTTGKVKPLLMAHIADAENGVYGIEGLITDILKNHGAVLPLGIESTELRNVAISASMFTEEIVRQVQSRFAAGSTRYPDQSVKVYLGDYMLKRKKSVCKIILSNKEDKNRPCCRPRSKWYLVQS